MKLIELLNEYSVGDFVQYKDNYNKIKKGKIEKIDNNNANIKVISNNTLTFVVDIVPVKSINKKVSVKNINEEIKNILKEEQVYFNTYSDALNNVRKNVEKKYDIDEDDWFNQLSVGGKPSVGKTKKGIGIDIFDKNTGKAPGKKKLHVQVYAMENGKYELNWYIS